jgi:hypothetical protein
VEAGNRQSPNEADSLYDCMEHDDSYFRTRSDKVEFANWRDPVQGGRSIRGRQGDVVHASSVKRFRNDVSTTERE